MCSCPACPHAYFHELLHLYSLCANSLCFGFGENSQLRRIVWSFIGETGASLAPFYKMYNFRNTITSRSAKPIYLSKAQ